MHYLQNDQWSPIENINEARYTAGCTVFEGKIIVTGGIHDWYEIKSVEAYHYYENKWTYLPDMIEERCFHATVSMVNKMFVIGGHETSNCEMFNSCYRCKLSIITVKHFTI